MRYARFILACLIALSVAVLPAAAGVFAATAKLSDVAMSSSMPDCCDHEVPPCDKPAGGMGHCATFSCMAKCFSYVGASSPGLLMPARIADLPNWTTDLVLLKICSPPFRPPQV
jgi:hypothetical protein